MNTIHITPEERRIIAGILKNYPPCYVFGSRVKGTHKKFSDLDICIKGEKPLPDERMAELKGEFSDSNLPYKVDIVDYHTLSPSFREVALASWVPFHP